MDGEGDDGAVTARLAAAEPAVRAAVTGPAPADGPAHTGSDPARAEPAVRPATDFPLPGAVVDAVNAAMPEAAVGHETAARRETGIEGIFTVRPVTGCAGTDEPAEAGGGPAQARAGTATAGSIPAANELATTIATRATNRRRSPPAESESVPPMCRLP